MDAKRTVSVVMCTYNGEKFLREQLDSILAQTYPIMEIIVQDDCSTDGTVDIINEYASSNPAIKLFQNECRLGYNLNFKTATMRATGHFVAFSDQDDVWFPRKIERLVDGIGNHSVCFCDLFRGSEQSKSKRVNYKYTFETLLFRPFVGHSMLLRRDFVQADANWKLWKEYDWSIELAAYVYGNGIAKIDEPLIWHRTHSGEVTAPKPLSGTKPKVWHPYVYGWKIYRQLQSNAYWQETYSRLNKLNNRNELVGEITECLLSHKIKDLLRLCRLCMVHKDVVYPGNAKGVKGYLRGFFFPSIFAYFNKGEFV